MHRTIIIQKIELTTEAKIPGIDNDKFQDLVQKAKAGCPVSKALQADARLSYNALSKRVHLSPPAVAERVRRLEAAGVISGYRATVDPANAASIRLLEKQGFELVDPAFDGDPRSQLYVRRRPNTGRFALA